MQLRQLQVGTDSIQDRLLLRFSTAQNEEFRVWLTRRFLRQIWSSMLQMSERLGPLPSSIQNGGDETGLPSGTGTFEPNFIEEDPIYPLGRIPVLASEAKLDLLDKRNFRLTLSEGRERSCSLILDGELLDFLLSMLRAAEQQSDWDLDLDYEDSPAPPSPPPVGEPPPGGSKLLH